MTGRFVMHFQIIERSRRAQKAISLIRRRSKQFKQAVAANDGARMEKVSEDAWNSLTNLFETLRNQRDHGYLDSSDLADAVGLLIEPVTQQEQANMAEACKINRLHTSCRPLSLAEALNKLGHYNADLSTYRIDGRGAHFLVLGGCRRSRNWVAEVLVSRLCSKATIAVKAIRQLPHL
jgi:hypothetical protein